MTDAVSVPPRPDRLARALFRFRQSRLSVIGAVMVAVVLLLAVFGPMIAPYPQDIAGAVSTAERFQPPSLAHPLGTNELGQDVLSLTLGGTRVSVLAGFGVVLIGAAIGTLVGAVAGYVGGWTDEALMRLTDLTLTIPGLILAMAIAAALGPGFQNMVLAISLSWWPGYARLVRGEVLAAREEVYVTAARALGAGPGRILFRHVLPNCVAHHREDVAGHGLCHPDRGGAGLYRHRGAPAHAGMGHAAVDLARLYAGLLVDRDGARAGHVHRRLWLQPAGRRAARQS